MPLNTPTPVRKTLPCASREMLCPLRVPDTAQGHNVALPCSFLLCCRYHCGCRRRCRGEACCWGTRRGTRPTFSLHAERADSHEFIIVFISIVVVVVVVVVVIFVIIIVP